MKVVIADDHRIFLSGLQFLLENYFENLEITQFDNGKDVLEHVLHNPVDIVIADIDMPHMNGLELCKEISDKNISAKVIILTMHKDVEMLKLAFYHGALGYLVKENTSDELVDCIQAVLKGEKYLAKEVRDQEQKIFKDKKINPQIAEILDSLTNTELKTLKLVGQNYSSKEIADLLFVSVKSVDNYRSRICKKLNLDAKKNSLLMWVLDNKVIIDNLHE
jgi:DNA-binding NarL/FixJ family response regulator